MYLLKKGLLPNNWQVHSTLRAEPPFVFFFTELHQLFEATALQTSGLVNLVFSHQTGLSNASILLVIKPMVTIEPAVP